jgi:predicted amidophosphoribosyltransferase
VDDVLTTGATLRECAATLKTAGAARVYALAFCRAD